jgi:riboflavin kinase
VPVVLTSREAGERIGVSQQAADRYLMALDKEGYVTRTFGARKQRLLLTPLAVDLLRKEYHGYRRIFEGPAKVTFRGTVSSGLGEGRYYLSQPGYVVQFTERLGYTPFPGTLNVRVSPSDMLKVGSVKHWSGIRIDGFQASGRTFGGATCYPGILGGPVSHLIIPDRTHHQDVVEFISAVSLREALRVKDGDGIDVEIREA